MFVTQVDAKVGHPLTAAQAATLKQLATVVASMVRNRGFVASITQTAYWPWALRRFHARCAADSVECSHDRGLQGQRRLSRGDGRKCTGPQGWPMRDKATGEPVSSLEA